MLYLVMVSITKCIPSLELTTIKHFVAKCVLILYLVKEPAKVT